jgi:transposase
MSRTPSVDAAVVAARLQAGETRAEIAQRLGTSYANVVAAARRWQRLSGRNLPRVRRGRIGSVETKHVTPRMQAVVAAYRPEGVTLRQVGAQFGKSAEWVRLQLNAYEDLTGERIARKPYGKRGPRLTIPRTPWQCPDCGQRRDLTPAQAMLAPKRCRPCAIAHVCLPSPVVERWIKARTEGQSWRSIAAADGRSIPAIYRAVYLYLRRNDRLDEIPLIWGPEGKVGWLRRLDLGRGAGPPPLAPVTCRPS